MFDILLKQFFSLERQQQAISENTPMGEFHLKAFTEVASREIFFYNMDTVLIALRLFSSATSRKIALILFSILGKGQTYFGGGGGEVHKQLQGRTMLKLWAINLKLMRIYSSF